jgi:hypothetical protein
MTRMKRIRAGPGSTGASEEMFLYVLVPHGKVSHPAWNKSKPEPFLRKTAEKIRHPREFKWSQG